MNERGERPFNQLIREGAGRVITELESFPKRFISLIARNPAESVLICTTVALSIYEFGITEGAEAYRAYILPKLAMGAVLGIAIAIPATALSAYFDKPQS